MWQPIKTAPKDGTRIDLWIEDEDCAYRIPNAYWNDGNDVWLNQPVGWVAAGYDYDGEDGPVPGVVTHWMYEPEPPEDAKATPE